MKTGRLSEKVAIITGAASGIGKGTALLFAEEGAKLVLVDRNEKKLEETLDEILAIGGEVRIITGDVSENETITRTISCAKYEFGGIDILQNEKGNGSYLR